MESVKSFAQYLVHRECSVALQKVQETQPLPS